MLSDLQGSFQSWDTPILEIYWALLGKEILGLLYLLSESRTVLVHVRPSSAWLTLITSWFFFAVFPCKCAPLNRIGSTLHVSRLDENGVVENESFFIFPLLFNLFRKDWSSWLDVAFILWLYTDYDRLYQVHFEGGLLQFLPILNNAALDILSRVSSCKEKKWRELAILYEIQILWKSDTLSTHDHLTQSLLPRRDVWWKTVY